MTLLRRNSSARGSVGLDIDGGYLSAVQLDRGRIERAASVELAPGAMTDGEVADKAALASALKDFFKRTGLPRTVRLGVANQQIVVRQVELPQIDDGKEREMAIRFQAAEAIAMPLDDAVLDHQVAAAAPGPDGAPRMQVIVVAARRTMISELVAAARAAGLKPEGIDLDAFALVRTLAPVSAGDDPARVYCHLGGVGNLAIAVGSSCLFTRALSASMEQGSAAVLADEIRLSIDYYMAQPHARPVGEVVLSGPGSRREGLAEQIGAQLGLPASCAQPLGGLDASGLSAEEDPHRHTVAAGLALGAAA